MNMTSGPIKPSTTSSGKPQALPAELSHPEATIEPSPRRLSLRILLLLIFAAALSPVLVIGGIRWSGDIEREAQHRREKMTLVAQEAASRAEYMLASAPGLLSLIDSVMAGAPCAKPLTDLAESLPPAAGLGVIDKDGFVVCSTTEGARGTSVADRQWFKDLRDGPDRFVQSAAIFAPFTKRWVVAVARRREDADGRFLGGFALGVPVDGLLRQLQDTGLPKDSEVALLDSTGRVFASAHWDQLDSDVMTRIAARGPGFFDVKSSAGQDRQLAIVPMSQKDLFVLLSAPKPPPIALENVSAFGNFALPLLAWLLALVTAWLAMDRLVLRWLDYLRRIAGLYASGKLSVQPLRAKRQAPGEINVLADTLEEMAVRIRDRTGRMEAAIEGRDAAMKEIHHRVKNNLQIINSLLSLQSRKLKDPAAVAVLDDARARINALSLIHRSLYEHGNIRSVDVKSFFSELVTHLDQALGAEDQDIRIDATIDNDTIDADVAVPLALFTAEAVTAAVKHAFPEGRSMRGGRVHVTYTVNDAEAVLTVSDDGVTSEQVDAAGIGNTLMAAFAKQVHGALEQGQAPSGGRFTAIRIPRVDGVTGAWPHTPALVPAK
jgi:two-component sensor histidine kinase